MVARAPMTGMNRIALQVDRDSRFYGKTRSRSRFSYREGIPVNDDGMRKPSTHGLTRKAMRAAEIALSGMLNDAGY